MPDPTPEPIPAPPAKKKRAAPQIISRGTIADIELAEACVNAAAQPGLMALLAGREWTESDQSTLRAAVQRARDLIGEITTSRSKKQRRTKEEEAARESLLAALDPVTTCAKRTFPGDDQPERRLFGVGIHLTNSSTPLLYNLTVNIHTRLIPRANQQPEFTLKGLKPAEIAALGTLAELYNNADFVQSTATQSAGDLLLTLNKHLRESLNPLRRELQLAADTEWPWRNPANANQRKAFGIPVDRPAGE